MPDTGRRDSSPTRVPTDHAANTLDTEGRLLAVLAALSSSVRLRVLDRLRGGPRHVSQLARDLELGRPLLHMHLDKLEGAGLVHGHLELTDTGKALRVYELVDFTVVITPDVVTAALARPVLRAAEPIPTDPAPAKGDPA